LRSAVLADLLELVGAGVDRVLFLVGVVGCLVLEDADNLLDALLYWELKLPTNRLGADCFVLFFLTGLL